MTERGRHCGATVSFLVRGDLMPGQVLSARHHPTSTLMFGRYAHVQLVDQTQALDALSAIDPAKSQNEAARAVGTAEVVPHV